MADVRPCDEPPRPAPDSFGGLNLRPGPDDDGWRTPEPVDLPDGTRLHLFKDGEAPALDALAARLAITWRRVAEAPMNEILRGRAPVGEEQPA